MGASNTSGNNFEIFKMIPEDSKLTNSPRNFRKIVKTASGYGPEEDRFNTLDGILIDIEFDSYVHEGKTNQTVMFFLQDESGSMIKLEANMNNLTRSMLNAIASGGEKNSGAHYRFKLYVSKSGYPNCFVERKTMMDNDFVKADWAYKPGDFPAPKKETVKVPNAADMEVYVDEHCNKWFKGMTAQKIKPFLSGLEKAAEAAESANEVGGDQPTEREIKKQQDIAANEKYNADNKAEMNASGPSDEDEDDLPF